MAEVPVRLAVSSEAYGDCIKAFRSMGVKIEIILDVLERQASIPHKSCP